MLQRYNVFPKPSNNSLFDFLKQPSLGISNDVPWGFSQTTAVGDIKQHEQLINNKDNFLIFIATLATFSVWPNSATL